MRKIAFALLLSASSCIDVSTPLKGSYVEHPVKYEYTRTKGEVYAAVVEYLGSRKIELAKADTFAIETKEFSLSWSTERGSKLYNPDAEIAIITVHDDKANKYYKPKKVTAKAIIRFNDANTTVELTDIKVDNMEYFISQSSASKGQGKKCGKSTGNFEKGVYSAIK